MNTPEAPIERPLVQLPSGIILDVQKVAFIARQELNSYVVHFANVHGIGAKIDASDLDALRSIGIVQAIPAVEKEVPTSANDGKIEIAA